MSIHSEALRAIRALREFVERVPGEFLAKSEPAFPVVDMRWLDRVEASLSDIPEFSDVAARKLQELQERGYVVTGYAIEKPVEGGQPERGFINAGGFVGWWRCDASDSEEVRKRCTACSVECMVNGEPCGACNGTGWSGAKNIPFDASRVVQASDSEEVRKKLPLSYPQGEPGIGGVLLHGTVLVPGDGQDNPQPLAVARLGCPVCKGDSGYMEAVSVDWASPLTNPDMPFKTTGKYKACVRCDGSVSLDGAHWYREPVFPIGYETQPANGQRIAGLNDQRQNEPQIIPKNISAPLADHIAASGNMVALDGDPPLCVSDFGKEVRNAE